MFRRLWNASVWGPNGVAPEDWRYRGVYRWVLPLTDTFFFWFGIVGWFNGVNSVQAAASPEWQTYWSLGIAIAAVIAFFGVVFPRLWWVELIGKLPLIGLVAVYVVIFIAQGLTKTPNMLATAGLITILVLLPIWRAGDLGFVAWKRKDAKEEAHTAALELGEPDQ